MAAPTLTAFQQSTYTDTGTTPEATAALSWNANDLIIAIGITEGQTATMNTPTATGLTFTPLATVAIASTCRVYAWWARASGSGSQAISCVTDGATQMRGLSAWAWGGSDGIGMVSQSTAAESAITRSLRRGGPNSAVVFGLGDFTANADTTVTASPSTNGTVRVASTITGRATMFTADWTDQGAAATTSYGLSGASGVTTNTMVAIEILGSASGTQQVRLVGAQSGSGLGTTSAIDVNFALTGGIGETVPAAGDLVVATYFIGSTVDRGPRIRNTSNVDYTTIGAELQQADNFDANQLTAYRFMPGTPETAIRFTEATGGGTGDAADAYAFTIHVFRGVDTGTVMDVAAVTAGATNSSAVDCGSITPTTAGSAVYAAGGAASATGSTMTSINDLWAFRAATGADTNDASVGAGYVQWVSGAFDPAAFGSIPGGTTANSWTGITCALRAATVGGGGDTSGRLLLGDLFDSGALFGRLTQ